MDRLTVALSACFVLIQTTLCTELKTIDEERTRNFQESAASQQDPKVSNESIPVKKSEYSIWSITPMLGTSPHDLRHIAAAVEPILRSTDKEGVKEFKTILNSNLPRGERMKKLTEWAHNRGGRTLEVFNEQMQLWSKEKAQWDKKVYDELKSLSDEAKSTVIKRLQIENDPTINEFQSALEVDALMARTKRRVSAEIYTMYEWLMTGRKSRTEVDDALKACGVLLHFLKSDPKVPQKASPNSYFSFNAPNTNSFHQAAPAASARTTDREEYETKDHRIDE